jgi:hypothetical protein
MNVHDARVVLRPRSLPDVIDLTLRVCHSAHARAYAVLAALTLLPAYGLCLLLQQRFHWPWLAVWLVALPLAGLLQGVFTVAAGRLLFAERVPTGAVLRHFAARLFSYGWTLLVLRVLPVVMVVGAPLIFLFPFLHEAVLLEDAGLTRAASRSGRLTKTSRALAVELGLLALSMQALAILVAEVLGQALVDLVFEIHTPIAHLWDDGGSPFALAGLFVAVPYVATARFLTYIDLRTRKEGWDLQLELSRLGAEERK